MSTLHEPGIHKAQRTIGYLLSILASFAVLASGLLKFTQNAWAMEPLEKLGLSEHAMLVGAIEALCALLYWIPKTSNIGFFLLCSYAGGIIVGELLMGEAPVPGVAIGAMIYLGTLLRKPSLSGLNLA
jgi:hypothetical protein